MIRSLKFSYFTYFLGHSGVMSFLSLYLAGLGLSGREIGALLATGPIVGLLVQPAWSLLADRRGGVRGALVLALSGAVAASALLPLGKNYTALVLLIVSWAFFFNAIDPLLNSLTLGFLDRRADAFGRVRLYGSFGNAASQAAVGWLAQVVHGAAMFYWQSLFLLLSLWGVLRVKIDHSGGQKRVPALSSAFRKLWGNKVLFVFLLTALLLQTSQVMGWSYFALYAQAKGASPLQAGAGLWIAVVSAFPFFYWGEALLGRFGPYRLLAASALAYTVRWGMLSLVQPIAAIYAVQLLNGFCYGLYVVSAVAVVHRETPGGLKATGQGLLSAVHISLATISGGLLGGFLVDWGGVTWIYRVGAGLAITSFLPLAWINRARAPIPAAQDSPQSVRGA